MRSQTPAGKSSEVYGRPTIEALGLLPATFRPVTAEEEAPAAPTRFQIAFPKHASTTQRND